MYDYSEKRVYGPAETGEYELSIEEAAFGQTDSGINYISLNIVIRDDVDQDYQGVHIYDTIWENEVFVNSATGRTISKEKYDKLNPQQKAVYKKEMQYSDYKVRPLVQAQDVDAFIKDANGNEVKNPQFKTNFDSMDEVVFLLNGLNFKATVNKTFDEKQEKDVNRIDYKTVTRTENSDTLPF